MHKSKTRVAIVCGGRSPEHDVSLSSARNVHDALDPNKYAVQIIRIGVNGIWERIPTVDALADTPTKAEDSNLPFPRASPLPPDTSERNAAVPTLLGDVDVVFPIIHGPYGEDGCLQGMLRMFDIPFVGSDVLGSAVGMDKDVMKRLLSHAGLPVCKYFVLRRERPDSHNWDDVTRRLGACIFVKPANAGSSIGISRATSEKEFTDAAQLAFQFDNKILCEEAIVGREVECAVIGNDKPVASTVGELVVNCDFYSYDAKYSKESTTIARIPAEVPADLIDRIRKLAVDSFVTLECAGLARVDFFVSHEGAIYVNEINTLPGFTNISMYPKLWEASGLSYPALVDQLIQLAIQRHQLQSSLLHCRA